MLVYTCLAVLIQKRSSLVRDLPVRCYAMPTRAGWLLVKASNSSAFAAKNASNSSSSSASSAHSRTRFETMMLNRELLTQLRESECLLGNSLL